MLIRLFFLLLVTLPYFTAPAQTALYQMPPWQKLRSELSNYSLIGLGEVGHGYESINAAKGTVLDFLRQQAGVKAVAFESSFTLCTLGYLRDDSLESRVTYSLYPFWNTASVQAALRPFYEREKEGKPSVLGCDIQEDCRYVRLSHYLVAQGLIKSSAGHLQASDSILAYYIGKDFSRKQALSLEEYRMLTSSYEAVASELRSALLPEFKKQLLLRALENRKWLCRYLTLSTARERMYYRDSLMAQNVVWLKTNLYPQNKIALWAANTHVAGQRPAGRQPQWMGDWLAGYFKGAYYPISFQKGSFAGAELLSQDTGIRYGAQQDNFSAYIVLNKLTKIPSNQWRTPCE